ncbi:MAG: DMT family transporter [Bacillota bacterium]|nr:DMT family transporter [Bacillota bacterium]
MKKGYLYILLTTIFFSSMEIALKLVTNEFNPIQITFLRFFIASLILMPLAVKGLKKRNVRLNRSDIAYFALTGFICIVVSMILYQMAILYAHASVVAVLFSCNPIFVILFAYLMLHEKIYKHTIVSLIVNIAGIIVIMNPLHMSGTITGIVLTILSAITFALYSVMGRKLSEKYGGIALTCFSFLFGSLEMLLLIFVSKVGAVSGFLTQAGLKAFADVPILQGITLHSLLSLVYVSLFATGLGYAFYFLAMEETSASTTSLVFFIKPALAPIMALVILGEPITLNMAIGIILIITGSLISFIPGYRMSKENANAENIEAPIEKIPVKS